jgi:rRNA-processing protein FCF1
VFELRQGIGVAQTAQQLRECATQAQNVISAGGPDALRLRDEYLLWFDQTGTVLASAFAHPESVGLESDRFWRIREIQEDTARPFDLIYAEIRNQASRLKLLADELQGLGERFGEGGATIAIPDTNVFLHFRLFDEVPWLDVLQATSVQLVVPLVVLQELDDKRNSHNNRLRRRARKVLSRLEPLLTRSSDVSSVAAGITIEALIENDVGIAADGSADSRILETCKALTSIAGARVTIVTGDVAMRVRAGAEGCRAIAMPEGERLLLSDDVAEAG